MVGKGTREAKVVGSNPGNTGKNRTRTYLCKKLRDLRKKNRNSLGEKENIFLIFIHTANIYSSTQKNDARHLCVDIGDRLRIP